MITLMQPKQAEPIEIPNIDYRIALLRIERGMRQHPNCKDGSFFPVKHTFAHGMYIREIFCPAGSMILSYIHKHSNPLFLLQGDITIIEESGRRRVKAPCSVITPAGTQRIVFHHTDTIVSTVHLNLNNEKDINKIEKELYVRHYNELTKEVSIESTSSL